MISWMFGTGFWQWVIEWYVCLTILIYLRTIYLIKKEQGTLSPTRDGKGIPKVLIIALLDVAKWPVLLAIYGLSGMWKALK